MNKNILIVISDYYKNIADMLLQGAIAKITENNFTYEILYVPGALEIPTAIAICSETSKYVGYVALGCVIRGETYHFDIVANESSRAITDLGIHNKLIIGNGILTVENEEQAINRANPDTMNKGGWAAKACIDLIKVKEKCVLQK